METNTLLLDDVAVHDKVETRDEGQARMHAGADALFATDDMLFRTSEFDHCDELKQM